MKFLYFTDTHIRGTTPKNRTDNLLETLERKFLEVVNIARNHHVDYILHGGDLFDRPDISISIARRFALILSNFNIPIYAIAGNHDLFGHNPETLHRTLLGLFEAFGIIRLIDKGEKIILEKNNIKVQITGEPYRYDIDNHINKSAYILEKKPCEVNYAIHMVHGMLLEKPFIKGIPYTLIDDIVNTKADITLAGHYHSGFGLKEVNDKFFVNPGSLIRITNSLREIDRMPKVVLITLDKDIHVDLIELQSAKPGNQILDRKQIEISMYRNERIIQFKQSVDSAVDFDKLDISHILNSISVAEGISNNIKEEAINRIATAQMLEKGADSQG